MLSCGAAVRRSLRLALAASWLSVWSLYATYTWTAQPSGNTLQVVRFYVPALGAMALLGAWLVVRVPRRASVAALMSAAVAAAAFGLGVWSYNGMREGGLPAVRILHGVWLPLGSRVGPAAAARP